MIARLYLAWLRMWFPPRFSTETLREASDVFADALRDIVPGHPRRAAIYCVRAFVAVARDGVAERIAGGGAARGRTSFARDLFFDAAVGARRLGRSPGYVAVTVASLVVGVGLNAVLFSTVNSLLWAPLDVPHPEEIVRIFGPDARESLASRLSLDEVEALNEGVVPLQGVAGALRFRAAAEVAGMAVVADGEMVTHNYLTVLGVAPLEGRGFSEVHRLADGERVAILSSGFGSLVSETPGHLLGETLRLNQEPFTVVGILPPGFGGLNFSSDIDVLVSFSGERAVGVPVASDRTRAVLSTVGRLVPGATVAETSRSVQAVIARLDASSGLADPNAREFFVLPERVGLINPAAPELVRIAGGVALLGCVLLLLVACANVAGLALARSVSFLTELRVRTALGASRGRLFRQLVTEGAVLVVPAALLGAVPLLFAEQVFASLLPVLATSDIRFALDARVIAWIVLSAVIALLMAGALPALFASESQRGSVAGTGRGRGASGLSAVMRILVAAEIALAVVVLVIGGVFLQTVRWYSNLDIGFATAERAAITVDVGFHALDEATGRRFFDELATRLEGLAGVAGVGVAEAIAASGRQDVSSAASEVVHSAMTNVVAPGFLQVSEIPILRGRDFANAEMDGPPAAIISEALERMLWPSGSALDRTVRLADSGEDLQVVGVVRDIRPGAGAAIEPVLYRPFAQVHRSRMTLVIESSLPLAPLLAMVRDEIEAIQPGLPVARAGTVDEIINADRHLAVAAATVGFSLGLAAVLLAAVGIFGMLAFTVRQQRGEIGVRLALGASPARVFRTVLGSGLRLSFIGVAIGLPPAIVVGSSLRGLALGSRPLHPEAFLGVLAVFVVVGVASAVPASRASRLSPSSALSES